MPFAHAGKKLKQLSQNGQLDVDSTISLLRGDKQPSRTVSFKADELRDFFPAGYTAEQIKDAIIGMLESRQRSRGRER